MLESVFKMKVICAGFWKTGTKSLAQALKILGYKVYDYDDQLFEFPNLWSKFRNGTVTDDEIRKALEKADVLIDGPVIAFWEEISKVFPQAKIILTTRDEESWWNSLAGMMSKIPTMMKLMSFILLLTPSGRNFIGHGTGIFRFATGVEGPFTLPFLGLSDNPRLYKYKFRQHNSHVIHSTPNEKLLIRKLDDGWDSLCAFLEKDVPDIPYPHKNKDGAHHTTEGGPQHPGLKQAKKECAVVLAILIAIISFIVYRLFTYI